MRHQSLYYLLASVLGLLLIGLLILSQSPRAPAAHAAPQQTHSLYLPLILRGCTQTQLIQDGSFEAGVPSPSWVTTSTVGSDLLDNSAIPSPNPTHSGTWKAWLGGQNAVQETLWQVIAVPAGSNLRVSFWLRVTTNEPNPLTTDWLDVQIRNTLSATLETLDTFWDGDAGTLWVQRVYTPTGNYAGQTIHLAFAAQTDNQYSTDFFIDDVSVQICAP
jgi:hypothetical protein